MNKTVNQVSEGRNFEFLDKSHIKTSFLKTFSFEDKEQYIKIETPEFSAVCPFSGLPDIAFVTIEYFPIGGVCIELKSLKYYMTSYRNVGLYQEGVTSKIYEDISRILSTNKIKVTTAYNVRGGFTVTCIKGKI